MKPSIVNQAEFNQPSDRIAFTDGLHKPVSRTTAPWANWGLLVQEESAEESIWEMHELLTLPQLIYDCPILSRPNNKAELQLAKKVLAWLTAMAQLGADDPSDMVVRPDITYAIMREGAGAYRISTLSPSMRLGQLSRRSSRNGCRRKSTGTGFKDIWGVTSGMQDWTRRPTSCPTE